jgi:hypothetical protein
VKLAALLLGLAGCLADVPPPAPAAPAAQPPGLTEPLPPLPALELHYNSPADHQFAVEASAAARRGDCRMAVKHGKQLPVDTRHKLASVDDAYARCVETQP